MGYSVTTPPGPPRILYNHHHPNPKSITHLTRRSLLLSAPLSLTLQPPPSSAAASPPPPDTTITDRVFMDFSLCPTYFRPLSSADSKPTLCPDSVPLGRLVLGLYGHHVPLTVSNFKSMCTPPPTRALSSTSFSPANSSSPATKATSPATSAAPRVSPETPRPSIPMPLL
ncbi:Cyclophilin-like peptidyl-prolyl cis-trans isomerase family protein [Prunus dulcis]|uniref:Cyclophilin-like peptidyl-prolyl cis-trans isomerase family protein n=1 Tax=Prunus dulcis TaxID=3755 RepID=A0A4Y1RW63_PRUDU|nr:Cyclophilin-like peptidyl-prolyl cis-trans isomerase family protein [Prunus dulcis]